MILNYNFTEVIWLGGNTKSSAITVVKMSLKKLFYKLNSPWLVARELEVKSKDISKKHALILKQVFVEE